MVAEQRVLHPVQQAEVLHLLPSVDLGTVRIRPAAHANGKARRRAGIR